MNAPGSSDAAGDRRHVSVIGAGSCGSELYEVARRLGRGLAELGLVVVCGGLGGVMEAAARGAREAGGVSIGILPSHERATANPHLSFTVTTGLGEARNLAVVSSGDVVVAVGGAYGTLSEIGLAAKIGRPVILLDSWRLEAPAGEGEAFRYASSPDEALALVREILSL